MAVNKRKILEAAQKFLQKGALDRALREYRSLLELDPKDSGARLKLGDIHLRLGEKGDAVAAYLKVAHQFMKDGFDAKAVALYRQITKLAPDQIEVYVPLAELYHRLGLMAEAMAALQTATEGFQKAGRKREALDLLRRAAALDPTNTTSRLKIADLLRQQGMLAEALTEYDEVAAELVRNGEAEALASVYERVLEIEPGRLPTLLAFGRLSLASGASERAHDLAGQAIASHPDRIEALELHAETLQAIGRGSEETEPVIRRLADAHRARGNEDRARELLQRFLPAYDLTLSGVDDLGVADPERSRDERVPSQDAVLTDEQAASLWLPAAPPPPEEASAASPPAVPLPEADLDQLLAEAGVYLRFGKREKAIASLESVLAQAPEHPAALEKLAGALSHDGDMARAAGLFARAADAARARGDERAAAHFGARLAEIDPATPAAEIDPEISVAEIDPEISVEPEPVESNLEAAFDESLIELDGRHALPEPEPGDTATQAVAMPPPTALPEPEPEFEFEVDLDLSGESEPIELAPDEEMAPAELRAALLPEIELDPDAEIGPGMVPVEPETNPEAEPVGLALEEDLQLDREECLAPLAPAFESEGAKTPCAAASPKQILEDLEEADFYVQQGLHDEAEEVYRRILELAPTNPQALLRLGEIAAARGDDPGAGRNSDSTEAEREQEAVGALRGEDEVALGDDLADWDGLAEAGDSLRARPSFELPATATPAFDLPAEVDVVFAGEPAGLTEPPLAGADEAADLLPDEEADDLAVADEAEICSGSDASREPSHFDLAAELSDALDAEDSAASAAATPAPEAEESLEAIFSEFKRGVRKTLTAADHETHYDLGIAYREMGLLEDAIGEFQVALESPARRLDCLHLMGVCARDLKRAEDAIAFFRQALAGSDLSPERRAAISFDLGIALEESGDAATALAVLEEAATLEPDFPGIAPRIEALRALLSLTTSGATSVPGTAPTEVYESFDDLIAHAEAEFVARGSGARPESPPTGDEQPSASKAPPSDHDPSPAPPRGTSPRRRKISFG